MSAWVGLDVGGQAAKGVAADEAGAVIARAGKPTGIGTDLEALITIVRGIVDELSTACRVDQRIGIGVAGVFGREGVLRGSPNLPRLAGLRLEPLLAERLERPVVVENDANCAALGEALDRAEPPVASYLLVTVGSGIGSGLVLDGELYRGVTGFSCELGHTIVEREGRHCGCGNRGCLEAYVSETAAHAYVREAGGGFQREVERALVNPAQGYARAVFALADGGNVEAERIATAMTTWLGTGLGSAINLIDVPTVVIGGGIAPGILRRRAPLMEALGAALFVRSTDEVAVLAATRGTDAGAIGAARLAMQAR
jgi:glucokinase